MRRANLTGETAPMGYMAIARQRDSGWTLAPAPHGASFDPACEGALLSSLGIRELAVARFQLVAASSWAGHRDQLREAANVMVSGSGPVAIGAVMELLRSTQTRITVLSGAPDRARRIWHSIKRVEILDKDRPCQADVVIEATGRADRLTHAIEVLTPGGLIGILGSPRNDASIDLYTVHRKGLSIAGFHELARTTAGGRQALLDSIARWLAGEALPSDWFEERQAPECLDHYEEVLVGEQRAPFTLLRWEAP